jgi:hypothetical protein
MSTVLVSAVATLASLVSSIVLIHTVFIIVPHPAGAVCAVQRCLHSDTLLCVR